MKSTQGILLMILAVGVLFFFAKPWWGEVGLLGIEVDRHEKVIGDLKQINETKN